MSLKVFHIVFVTFSSLLSFAFGGWSLRFYQEAGSLTYLFMGILALAFGVGLIFYGFWFWRKITTKEEERKRRRKMMRSVRVIPVLVVLWLAGDSTVWACTVCYGEADGPLIDAARMGVFLLFGLVLTVQVGFASFFIYLWRRAKRFR